LAGSVNTNKVEKEFQGNHIQFGIAEQNMVSAA
jgi:transketolase C-terminal domain/subunit